MSPRNSPQGVCHMLETVGCTRVLAHAPTAGLAREVQNAMRAKGVDGEEAEQALAEVDDDDERAAARHLVERRLPALRRVDRQTATRRLIGMLARKGYNGGLAAGVVREVMDETGFGTEAPDADGWDAEDA